jgi:hypothetical protein
MIPHMIPTVGAGYGRRSNQILTRLAARTNLTNALRLMTYSALARGERAGSPSAVAR